MNVGQILETHLGLAARGLGVQIQEVLDRQFNADALRKQLKAAYEGKEMSAFIDKLV